MIRRNAVKAVFERDDDDKGFFLNLPRPLFAKDRFLVALDGFEGGARQKTMAEELHISQAAVSEMVSDLEEAGYVTRTVDKSDKRATLIKLTELGAARAAELSDEREERRPKLFEKLTEKEKDQLLKLLEKLTAEDEEDEESEDDK